MGVTERPVHLHWRYVGLVFAGGAIGTLIRYLVTAGAPRWLGIPFATLAVNVVGAFVLGALLELLALRGPDQGTRRAMRLFIGTGVLGGFTTYSALAVDTTGLVDAHQPWLGVGYAAATVVVGAVASIAGIATGARVGRPSAAPGSAE